MNRVERLRFLILGALSPAMAICNGFIDHRDFDDFEAERELIRSVFLGVIFASIRLLPLRIRDEEFSELFRSLEDYCSVHVVWTTSVAILAALSTIDSSPLSEGTRHEVYSNFTEQLSDASDPQRAVFCAVVNSATRLAIEFGALVEIDR